MSLRIGLSLSLVSVVLVACTPSHTLDKARAYSRDLGLTTHYDIQRWHNRRLPADSRILVSVNDSAGLSPGSLTSAIARNLSGFFSEVESLPDATSAAEARRTALRQEYQFLFALESLQWRETPRLGGRKDAPESVADEGQSPEGDPTVQPRNPEDHLGHVIMSIAIIDVVSNKTIDKVVIDTTAPAMGSAGGDIATVLEAPLQQLGSDLTGR